MESKSNLTAGLRTGLCQTAAALVLTLASAPALGAEGRFVDVTRESGVAWQHNTGAFGSRWLPETVGPGVLVLDANGDGKPDLLFVNGRNFPGKPGEASTPALYLNQGGLRFREATREAGLELSAYCMGGSAADIDNDGDPDVFLSCLGQDMLLRNEGGRFKDISREAGLSQEHGFAVSAAFFDADNDGLVDLYVTRYVDWKPETDVFCSLDGKTKSYCTPILYKGVPSRYYHNQGDGKFEDRTQAAGFWVPEGKMMGVLPLDADGDGWTDLLVAGDTHPNLLFHNKGNGTFEEVGVFSGVALSLDGRVRGGMGVDAGDFNHTGRPSVVITYFSNEMTGLYRNEGNMFFLDIGPNSDVGRKTLLTLGWGAFFFDFDLDGWLDLLIANGHLDDAREKSTLSQVTYAEPQQLFHNDKGTFREVTDTAGGDLVKPIVGRGAAFADLDGDGDLDLALTANGGPARIYENRVQEGSHWLRLSLVGSKSNRDGLGASVKLTAGGMTQTWFVHTGGTYLSQSQVEPTFGLGPSKTVDEIVIRWPSGIVQTLKNTSSGQVLKVVEPSEKKE